MRFNDLSNKTLLEFIEELDEVRMGSSDLAAFAKSPAAQGIRAGFEAELCFTGLGGGDDDDAYPEPNYDEDRSPRSISDVADFFYDGDQNGRADIARLREKMVEDFYEWRSSALYDAWGEVVDREVSTYIEENVFDFDDAVEEYLRDDLGLSDQQVRVAMNAGKKSQEIDSSKQLGLFADDNEAYAAYAEARDHAKEQLQELVVRSLEDQDENYDAAREQWEEGAEDDYSEREWLESEGMNSMSDISSTYDISWPYHDYPSNESGNEYNIDNANDLARNLGNTLGVEVKASSGYHSTKRREGLWIMEPDSSLEADDGDMPVEIISPPMPLEECLRQMREFFSWAKNERAYSNESTGLHVGISLPGLGGKIDYVKLALFLGDNYVLEKFKREGNTYCRSALEKIEKDVFNKDPEQIVTAISAMRSGLSSIASGLITNEFGHGKYTSINLKGDYVEFRSMGGEDYINNIDDVINTVQRFALAMSIAGDRDAYRDEYNKKLYKLINPKGESDTIAYFAAYAAGTVPKNTLKYWLRQQQTERQAKKLPPGSGEKWWWKVVYQNAGIEVVAVSEESAKRQARVYWQLRYAQASDAEISAERLAKYDPARDLNQLGARRQPPEMPPAVPAARGNPLPGNQEYEVYKVGTGEVVGRFVNSSDPESARIGFQRFLARYDISNPAEYGYRAVR